MGVSDDLALTGEELDKIHVMEDCEALDGVRERFPCPLEPSIRRRHAGRYRIPETKKKRIIERDWWGGGILACATL